MNRIAAKFHLLRTAGDQKIRSMPVLILMPHSACNCRCVMCDIWKANTNKQELTGEAIRRALPDVRRLGVRRVVLSGGEALLHRNLWQLCALLKTLRIRNTLLSTGLLLERHASDIVQWCDEVIVSLDGSREVHDAIRGVPGAFDRMHRGIRALRHAAPGFRVAGRCVIQKKNYFDLQQIVQAAKTLGLDQISFLAVDVFSTAFNRSRPWDEAKVQEMALNAQDLREFRQVLEQLQRWYAADFDTGFIAESPEKLARIHRYFAAVLGEESFPPVRCNAPWVSAVIEPDGSVRPCFFHAPLGNIHEASLGAIVNSPAARQFRRALDVQKNPICGTCTCSLYLRPGVLRTKFLKTTKSSMKGEGGTEKV